MLVFPLYYGFFRTSQWCHTVFVLKGAKTGGEIQKSVSTNVDELKLVSVGSTSDHVISQHPASFVVVAPTDVKIYKRGRSCPRLCLFVMFCITNHTCGKRVV